MTEAAFWHLIEQSRAADDQTLWLIEALRSMPASEVISYENIFRRTLVTAYSFPVLVANFVICSYTSDDVFVDFRAWLISQCRQRFESALSNPDSIANWLDRDQVDAIGGEEMLFVAQKAFQQHGDANQFYDQVSFPYDPEIEMNWPDTKAEFEARYPQLVRKLWNQERINELHSD